MARAKAIRTERASKAVGPYSQGVDAGDYIFVSGQAGIDPQTGKAPEGNGPQAEQAFKLWLTKPEHFDVVNEIYARFIGDPASARSALIVAAMPRGFLMGVAAIAKRP